MILSVLPQTVLLNIRPDGKSPKFVQTKMRKQTNFEAHSGTPGVLQIVPGTRFSEVDGQHRIDGLLEAASHDEAYLDFPLPTSIVDRLSLSQEAGQFLTVNRTQKKVEADLELRVVFHRNKRECSNLVKALSFDMWRVRALQLAIELNDTKGSPWEGCITTPGDQHREVISERAFVNSLEPVCAPKRAGHLGRADPGASAQFLRNYWTVICEKLPRASSTDKETRRNYVLRKGLGVGALHMLAPLVYDLCFFKYGDGGQSTIGKVVAPVLRKYKDNDWASRGGKLNVGSNKASMKKVATLMAQALLREFSYEKREFSRLHGRSRSYEKTCVAWAADMFNPLVLREFDRPTVDGMCQDAKGGVYVLAYLDAQYRLKSVYAGKSEENLARRIRDHRSDRTPWNFFTARALTNATWCSTTEGALWHLAKKDKIKAGRHPDTCPFC